MQRTEQNNLNTKQTENNKENLDTNNIRLEISPEEESDIGTNKPKIISLNNENEKNIGLESKPTKQDNKETIKPEINSQNKENENTHNVPSDIKDKGCVKILQYFVYPPLAFFITLILDMITGALMAGLGLGIFFLIIGVVVTFGLLIICYGSGSNNQNNNNNVNQNVVIKVENKQIINNHQNININQNIGLVPNNNVNDLEKNNPAPIEEQNKNTMKVGNVGNINIGGINNNQNSNQNVITTTKIEQNTESNNCTIFMCFLIKKGLWGIALLLYGFVDSIIAIVDTVKDIKANEISVEKLLGQNMSQMNSRCCQFIKKNNLLKTK